MIQNEPESRKDWMLYRFEFAGKFDNRIENIGFGRIKVIPSS